MKRPRLTLRPVLVLLLVCVGALASGCLGLTPGGSCAGVDAPTVQIDVTTSRYQFEPGTSAPIEVERCSTVVLRITSTDVTHGLAIDGYRVNAEIPAGETVEVQFVADRAGDFTMYCTVFCGSGHPQHKGTLHVA